ncbi:MAG TPA: alpha/beta hydrolase [Candidatus Saccharimonadales bacterium]|nr:alpha/beta hydrolase [Candidatus Saccharimonadales bacterium]
MPTIQAAGLDVEYVVDGAGPPLIALHGATGSGRDHFSTQRPFLAEAFRVYLPDARGHGGTRWDAAHGLATSDLADDVLAFADALGLETFHVLGYSMGAMTALHVAARAGDRLRTLVLVSIAAEREPRLAVGRKLMDPARIERDDPVWAGQLAARHDPAQGPGAWRRLLPAIVADISDQPLLSPAQLRGIESPTLVVAGDRDPFAPVAQAAGLARQVRDGRLLVLPDVGHDVLADRPATFHAALADFYRTTEPVARARAGDPPSTEVPA